MITDELLQIELDWEQRMLESGEMKFLTSLRNAKRREDFSSIGAGAKLVGTLCGDFATWLHRDLGLRYGKRGVTPLSVMILYNNSLSDLKEVAAITLRLVVSSVIKEQKLTKLAIKLGSSIEDQLKLNQFKRDNDKHLQRIIDDLNKKGVQDITKRREVLMASFKADNKSLPWQDWSVEWKFLVGEWLIRSLSVFSKIEECPLCDIVKVRDTSGETPYVVRPTNDLVEWLNDTNEAISKETPDFLPTLVKPKDWTTPWSGGFYHPVVQKKRPMVKVKSRRQQKMLAKQHKCGQLTSNYEVLNILQSTEWEINPFILKIAEKMWDDDNPVALPRKEPSKEPVWPDLTNRPLKADYDSAKEFRNDLQQWASNNPEDALRFKAWANDKRQWREREDKRTGKCIQTRQTLNLARDLLKHEKFHYVYSMDSRARIYCTCNQIGPQGAGLAKALIRFKNGTPIKNRAGVRNMYIHTAGLFGIDKCSIDERVVWVMDNVDNIRLSAQDPFKFRWWADADKPYQFLAQCKELVEFWIMKDAGGSLWKTFETKQPCAQDGSCNGIQHYSAMLRDPIGANAVNLADTDKPADIYGLVAERVTLSMQKVKDGLMLSEGQWVPADTESKELATIWLDAIGIDRKVTKKPVMVLPYGGTSLGNRASIEDYLRDFFIEQEYKSNSEGKVYKSPLDGIEGGIYKASNFINSYIWLALGEAVVAARTAMKFLKHCSSKIVNSAYVRNKDKAGKPTGNYVGFINPITGFPVDLTYMVSDKQVVNTYFNGRVRYHLQFEKDKVDVRRTGQGLPPNLVHNLDATHCLMTTLRAYKDHGITNFAMVHDSFACPAGQAEDLHVVLRECFYDMHGKYDMIKEFIDSNAGSLTQIEYNNLIKRYYMQCPKGDFDLLQVENSTHFFR